MDALTGALFIGASFASSLISSRSQYKLEQANIKLQTEQVRLQAAEAAYERTKQFRQNLSQNAALSGMGFGGVSGFRGVQAQSTADYFADVASLKRQESFAQITGNSNRALSRAKRLQRDVGAVTDVASLAAQLGIFAAKGGK